MKDMEIWKDIPGYEGYYQVSNIGNVKSLARKRHNILGSTKERILKLNFDSSGYRTVKLYKDGIKKTQKVHRLVIISFKDNPTNLPEVNHIDGIKVNNTVENLEWCSRLQNMQHATKSGLRIGSTGENNHTAKLKVENVIFIKYALKNNTHTQSQLANMFNVNYGVINQVKQNRTWKEVLL
jgi:hypothetical protein